MKTKRIVTSSEHERFVEMILEFVSDNSWTLSNVNDAITEVSEHFADNAILHEAPSKETSV